MMNVNYSCRSNCRPSLERPQSAVDRFKNAAYDFVIEGESYRSRLKPKLDATDSPPPTPAPKAKLHPRSRARRRH